MKRCVALLGLFVLAAVVPAAAQVTYSPTSVPTFVINSGDSEVLGSVRLTATTTNTIIPGSIQFYFPGVACDNDETSGITLVSSTGIYAPLGTAGVTFQAHGSAVVNLVGGCTVNITIANAVAGVVGNYIQLDGVRGRVEEVNVAIGGNINCAVFAFPSTSSLITPPSTVVVANPQIGFTGAITSGTQLLCLPEESVDGDINIKEGFNSAFVQNVTTAGGTPIPATHRPRFGSNANTGFKILVTNVPAGLVYTFPALVCGNELGCVSAAAGGSGDQLELVSGGVVTGAATPNAFTVVYEYACGNQSTCDTTLESFDISPDVTSIASTTLPSTISAQVEFNPRETVPPPGPTVPPFSGVSSIIAGASSPRFSDNPQPTPAANLLLIAPCTTNLLFPWIVSNVAQFDTGVAIANTSVDPFSAIVAFPTPAEHGTCTITGFPKGEGAPIALTTGDISAGDTYTAVLSSTVFNGFAGYIIARCNFQYGHGFAFLTNNFGTGMPPTVGQGYIALVIPDPVISSTFPSRAASPDTWSAFGANFNTGEELSQ
ncbi:MAG TPA: hypothetical protein VG204_18950 [Terriglobia bacterium]|nr:hypothetical protein [Terriglobia bacterium]